MISDIGAARPSPGSGALSTNSDYLVSLDVVGDPSLVGGDFPIVANMPERFNLAFSSNWGTPFANTDVGELAGNVTGNQALGQMANAGIGAAGFGTRLRSQSYQVWESSTPLRFNIDMIFNAYSNTRADVVRKQIALLKLAAPSLEDFDTLRAPGPRIADKVISGGRQITLTIGRYIRMTNVIVTDVSNDIATMFDADGLPVGMSINVSVESFNANFTTQDIDAMFRVP